MVFCKQCSRKVEDCPHFVERIQAPRIFVFDAKIETLAYSEQERILEIRFKSGQAWQLFWCRRRFIASNATLGSRPS